MITKVVGCLEKVFLDAEPKAAAQSVFSGFKNETISFQVAYCQPLEGAGWSTFCDVKMESDIAEHVRVRRVVNVPAGLAIYPGADDDYLRKAPGLYPDMLVDISECKTRALIDQWNSVWVDVEGAPAGQHEVTITVVPSKGEPSSQTVKVNVLDAELPAQELIYTRWLHCDAIAQY